MYIRTRIAPVVAAFVAVSILCAQATADEKWVRVFSKDKKVSVLFPTQPQKFETVKRKSPAGTIETRRARYETDKVLFVINGTTLPGVALAFASTDKILGNAVEGVLATYLGTKVSEKRIRIDGEPAVVLEYRIPDYEDEDHPGYQGIAIALLVDGALYVVNGILTKEDPKAKAKQRKLLGSIQVDK